MYLVFTRASCEIYCRRLRSLLILCDVFRALINSLSVDSCELMICVLLRCDRRGSSGVKWKSNSTWQQDSMCTFYSCHPVVLLSECVTEGMQPTTGWWKGLLLVQSGEFMLPSQAANCLLHRNVNTNDTRLTFDCTSAANCQRIVDFSEKRVSWGRRKWC